MDSQPAVQVRGVGVIQIYINLKLNFHWAIQKIQRLKIYMPQVEVKMVLLRRAHVSIVEISLQVEFQIGIIHSCVPGKDIPVQRTIDRKIAVYIVVEFKFIHLHFCIDVDIIHGHSRSFNRTFHIEYPHSFLPDQFSKIELYNPYIPCIALIRSGIKIEERIDMDSSYI